MYIYICVCIYIYIYIYKDLPFGEWLKSHPFLVRHCGCWGWWMALGLPHDCQSEFPRIHRHVGTPDPGTEFDSHQPRMIGGPTNYDGPDLYVAHASMHIDEMSPWLNSEDFLPISCYQILWPKRMVEVWNPIDFPKPIHWFLFDDPW